MHGIVCIGYQREGSRETFQQPSTILGGPTRELESEFLQGNVVTGQGEVALN